MPRKGLGQNCFEGSTHQVAEKLSIMAAYLFFFPPELFASLLKESILGNSALVFQYLSSGIFQYPLVFQYLCSALFSQRLIEQTGKGRIFTGSSSCFISVVSSLFGIRDWFCGRQFFHKPGGEGMVSGWFKCIVFIALFIAIIITSAPPHSRRRPWQPTPVLLPGKSHGWRSLVGCSPWGHNWTWPSNFTFPFHFHPLEKEMATHSSVLAWRIPGMGEPGGLPSMGSHRVRNNWSDLAAAAATSLDPRGWGPHQLNWWLHSQRCASTDYASLWELNTYISPHLVTSCKWKSAIIKVSKKGKHCISVFLAVIVLGEPVSQYTTGHSPIYREQTYPKTKNPI